MKFVGFGQIVWEYRIHKYPINAFVGEWAYERTFMEKVGSFSLEPIIGIVTYLSKFLQESTTALLDFQFYFSLFYDIVYTTIYLSQVPLKNFTFAIRPILTVNHKEQA